MRSCGPCSPCGAIMEQADEAEEEASYEDIKAITVRRLKLEQWVKEPFFERTLPGCMVRLSLGESSGSQGDKRPLYMLALMREVVERPPNIYKCAAPPGTRCCLATAQCAALITCPRLLVMRVGDGS